MRHLILILSVCMLIAVVGCDTTGPESGSIGSGDTWQCVSHSELSVAVVAVNGFFSYCEVRADGHIGSVEYLTADLSNMFKDGCWSQIHDTQPVLGPPPPTWCNTGLSDKPDLESIRINGSCEMPCRVYTPLPVHDEIHVRDLCPLI
jgi:hypothetical protein